MLQSKKITVVEEMSLKSSKISTQDTAGFRNSSSNTPIDFKEVERGPAYGTVPSKVTTTCLGN
jgi:hypothetical protein